MKVLYILPLCLLWYGLLEGQNTTVKCDVIGLLKETMDYNPVFQRQQIQGRRLQANRQAAAGFFDYQLTGNLSGSRSGLRLYDADPRINLAGNQLRTNNLSLSGGIQQTFRSSLVASANVEYYRIGDNYPLNDYGENIGSFVPLNNVYTTVSLRYPLLKGSGRQIVTAGERMADISIERQQYDAVFISSEEILGTIAGYWQYLASFKMLEVYRSNESRIRSVLDITHELVKAEKKPTSDLLQVQADLKDKERQTILAEQQLFAARQNLGRLIGWDQEKSKTLGLPENEFPKLEDLNVGTNLNQLLKISHRERADLKALRKSLQNYSISVQIAENETKPQLDLSAFAGYGGQDFGNGIGRFLTAFTQEQGRNFQVGFGLSYVFPVKNNQAKARLRDSRLLRTDQEIQLSNQIRNIELDVSIAYNNLLNSIEALKKSKQSLDFYEEVFNNEQLKFQSGLTTLLNLILFQERLTFAQLDYIQNQQQFAIAISDLRHETGTLWSQDLSNKQATLPPLFVFYTLPTE